jgi:hypothetical protein
MSHFFSKTLWEPYLCEYFREIYAPFLMFSTVRSWGKPWRRLGRISKLWPKSEANTLCAQDHSVHIQVHIQPNYLPVWIIQILFSSSLISVAERWNWCSCCHFHEQRRSSELGSYRVRQSGPTTRVPYTPVRPARREWPLSMKETGNPLPTAKEGFGYSEDLCLLGHNTI